MAFHLECTHGPRTGRTGISAGGRLWAGWFCEWRVCPVVWTTRELIAEVRALRQWAEAREAEARDRDRDRDRDAVWDTRTRKLLALAVSTDSEDEAVLALLRAREAHQGRRGGTERGSRNGAAA
jgi:hypothetical protein